MAVDLSPELPIAVFDSGVGGLTVLHECLVSLPEEDYVYLGDDARFPYGARSVDELRDHVEQVSRFLLARGAKLLVIACNSAASAGQEAAREVAAEAGIEVVAVIQPEAEIAAALSQTGKVGVLATPATVRSRSYVRALAREQRSLTVTEVEAPDLAAVIQRGFPFDEGVVEMVRSYCEPLKRAEVDTVILGCTHYPLVGADAPAHAGPRRQPGHRRPRDRGDRATGPRGVRTHENRQRRGDLPLPLHRGPRVLPGAGDALPADAAG